MPLLLVNGIKGDRGGLRVARAALPPPHLLHRVRHHGHHHQRVLQCEPACERTHLILRLPSSPPPVLRLTGAHLDLFEKAPKVLILQKWISASLYRATVECGRVLTARATVCPKSEASVGSGGKQRRRGGRPAFHYLQLASAAIALLLVPPYLPPSALICRKVRRCRRRRSPLQSISHLERCFAAARVQDCNGRQSIEDQ